MPRSAVLMRLKVPRIDPDDEDPEAPTPLAFVLVVADSEGIRELELPGLVGDVLEGLDGTSPLGAVLDAALEREAAEDRGDLEQNLLEILEELRELGAVAPAAPRASDSGAGG